MAITLHAEAISIDIVNLKWTDTTNPGNTHTVNRSSDGVSYVVVDTAAAAAVTYQDSGLATATKYWYKITEGANTSNIVTVTTQSCATDGTALGTALPVSDGDSVSSDVFNDAMSQLESLLQSQIASAHSCNPCPTDNTVVLDCSSGCTEFTIDASSDINSISIINCDEVQSGTINFQIPANTTVSICGFPQHFGFSGNECHDAPLSGGTGGRTVSIDFSSSGSLGGASANTRTPGQGPRAKAPSGTGSTGTSGAGGGGAAGQLPLTIACQTTAGGANTSCSADCSSAKALRFRVTGGSPPYTASTNSGGAITEVSDGIYKLDAPANAGSGVPGSAYAIVSTRCASCSGANCASANVNDHADYTCNDALVGCYPPASHGSHGISATAGEVTCTDPAGACLPTCTYSCPTWGNSYTKQADIRSAGMIAGNCNPCGLTMRGKTFTVQDSDGTSVVAVITN